MIYICNEFYLSMLADWRLNGGTDAEGNAEGAETDLRIATVGAPVQWLALAEQDHGRAVSAVGHADTAALFSALLGRTVEQARVNVRLSDEDILLVGQYVGPQMPEGSNAPPPGAAVRWLAVSIEE